MKHLLDLILQKYAFRYFKVACGIQMVDEKVF